MYSGTTAGYDVGVLFMGGYFGGNLPFNNTPQDGFHNFGTKYYEGGLGVGGGGVMFGAWWSKSNTIFFGE